MDSSEDESSPGSPEIPDQSYDNSVVSLYIYCGMYLRSATSILSALVAFWVRTGLPDFARIFTHFTFWQCSKLCPILPQTLTYFATITIITDIIILLFMIINFYI